jgi:hypothetical protein
MWRADPSSMKKRTQQLEPDRFDREEIYGEHVLTVDTHELATGQLVPGKSKAARRQKAVSTYATLVGAMVLARAVDDRALSQEILDAGLASVKA